MKLKILELIEYFHADQTQNNNTPFSSEDYEEAIAELEKLVEERNKFAKMGMATNIIPPAPDEEPLGSSILLLNENEKVFWQEAYIHAMKIRSSLISTKMIPVLESSAIADNAILELRLRLGSNLKKELINDN